MKRFLGLLVFCASSSLFAEEAKPVAPVKAAQPMLNDWLKDPERIKKYDKNGDGKIDPEERKVAREEFRKEFGIVVKPTAVEKTPGRGFDQWIETPENVKAYDKDGDGKINADERQAARKAWLQQKDILGTEKK